MKRTFHLMRSSIVLVRRMSVLTTAFRRVFLLLISFSVTFFSQAQAPVIDGDPSDWPGVFTNGAITIKNFVDDPVNSSADDIFTNGSSDVNPISTWAWTTSSANDKNDIGHAGIALVGTRIYFFSDRYNRQYVLQFHIM